METVEIRKQLDEMTGRMDGLRRYL